MTKKVYLIGTGPGDPQYLTGRAARLITECACVFATPRIAEQLRTLNPAIESCALPELADRLLACEAVRAAVLISGDTGFFSAAKTLGDALRGRAETELVNGLSSLQYLCAKAAVPYSEMEIVSLHGMSRSFLGRVAYHPRAFFLTGGRWKAHDVCAALANAGLSGVTVTAGEQLSLPGERIVTGTAQELSKLTFCDLTVLLVQNPHCASPHAPLRDTDFVRGAVPMTKEEVRWLSVQKLGVLPRDIVFDIGAGTGSVSVELARRACDGEVFAVEREDDALALIAQNRERHGAYNLGIVKGAAPQALEGLPVPDRAFIGGSGGRLREILTRLLARNPAIAVTVNAVTLETLHEAVSAMTQAGMNPEIVCVSVARARAAGGAHLMTAQNPVYIITGVGRRENAD